MELKFTERPMLSRLKQARIGLVRRLGTGTAFALLTLVREILFFARASLNGSFSQHGEDRFLIEYFGRDYRGFYIDVGASHPFIISNTYLLSRHGWRGITAEPIPYLWRRHRVYRRRDVALNVGVGEAPGSLMFHQIVPAVLSTFDGERVPELLAQGWQLRQSIPIEVKTLKDLYREHAEGARVDLLSVDVEGWDLMVLKGHDWSLVSPRLIICETDAGTQQAIDEYLSGKGYAFLRQFGCNRIYERRGPASA